MCEINCLEEQVMGSEEMAIHTI